MIERGDQPDTAGRDGVLAMLDFYVAAGVDGVLDEAPHDWFAAADEAVSDEPASRVAAAPEARPSDAIRAAAADQPHEPGATAERLRRAAAIPPDEAAADARRRAAAAATLAELEAIVEAFDGCALKASARRLAFADGVPRSRVMLVGEAPGGDEDRIGRPFVGRAGQLLDRMLAAIGLGRQDVYIANIVPWRPPGNRTPTPQEIAICRPFIERQIELAAPEILVTIGAPATQNLLGLKDGIFRTRGRWSRYEGPGGPLRALPILHPAYLLRQPAHKGHAWRDLKALKRALDEGASTPPVRDIASQPKSE